MKKHYSRVLFSLINCLLILLFFMNLQYAKTAESCLFKNPLCFYSTDILQYVQILFKQMQYENMVPFIYTPAEIKNKKSSQLVKEIEKMSFGYSFKRTGIREYPKGTWKISYQRTVLGTQELFTVHCSIINDTCRLALNPKERQNVFNVSVR